MRSGAMDDLRPGRFGIVLGIDLAMSVGARIGDKIVLIAPQGQVTPAGILPRLKQFEVVGIFEVDMAEYDAGLAFMHLEDAQKLYRLEDKVSGVRLKLHDLFRAPLVARDLMRTLRGDVYATDWTRSHANFFRAVQIEKRVMFIILVLIVAVAAFNIVSTLVMAVTDKRADIAILRTLGAAPGEIMQIFHHPGRVNRRSRHDRRSGQWRTAGGKHRRRDPGDRTCPGRPVPGQGRVLHQRSALRSASARTWS